MPIYEYKALTDAGSPKNGMLDADSPRDAREKLRRQRLFVTDMNPLDDKSGQQGGLRMPKFFGKVSTSDLSSMTRQLATLVSAGIPLAQGLQAIIEQSRGTALEGVMRQVKESVVQGLSFHEALATQNQVFSKLYTDMVKAGEASGTLDAVLTRLADFMQNQTKLRGQITAALAYPAMMVFVAIAVVAFLMIVIVPQITEMLLDLGMELPFTTQILITISDFVISWWWIFPIAAISAYQIWKAWVSTTPGRRAWDKFLMSVPVFGSLFKKVAVSRFAVTFSTLLKSGMPALDSLKIVSTVVNNQVMSDTIDQIYDRILEGTDISTPLKKSGVFPPVVGYMIAVGEQSGQLEELLDRIAASYDEEIELATQKFTAILEPLLIVVMAVVVGFIVFAILQPMLQISSGVGG